MHALLVYPFYNKPRESFMSNIKGISPNINMLCLKDQFHWLIANQDEKVIVLTADYIYRVIELRNSTNVKLLLLVVIYMIIILYMLCIVFL